MSAYMTFYIKLDDNNFRSLMTYSRCSNVFAAFQDYAQYGKNIPITQGMLSEVRDEIKQYIDNDNATIEKCKQMIKSIEQFANTAEEKYELIWQEHNTISEYQEMIEDYNGVLQLISHLQFLMNCADDSQYNSEKHRYSSENYLYLGYEAAWPSAESEEE